MNHLLRRAAALLATVSLLAVPARSAVACEMVIATSEQPGAMQQQVSHAGMAVDHHHATAPTPADGSPEQPRHAPCDHLVGCAPAAIANAVVRLPEGLITTSSVVPFAAEHAESPEQALEPPPPKR